MHKEIILTVFVSMLLLSSMVGMQFAAPARAATTGTAMIDLYTQKDGKGPNMPSDSFMPQELVILYANVTNSSKPISDKIVAFEVHGPPNPLKNITVIRTAMTNASGVATINFRIPWPDENPETIVLGLWIAYACVGIYEEKVEDTLAFMVGFTVAVTDIVPSKTVAGQGYSVSINVTVENQGDFTENFDLTAYANTTVIFTLTNITLTSGNSTTITFTWNTIGVPYGNYTISANAAIVLDEINTADNNYTDGWIVVTILGDVDGNYQVDWMDLGFLGLAYRSKPGDDNWNPNADINSSGKVDWVDLGWLGLNYGESCS